MPLMFRGLGQEAGVLQPEVKVCCDITLQRNDLPFWPQPACLNWDFWQHLLNPATIKNPKGTTAHLVQMAERKMGQETCFDTLLIFSSRIFTEVKIKCFLFFFFLTFYLFIFREKGRGGRMRRIETSMCKRNMDWIRFSHRPPPTGDLA